MRIAYLLADPGIGVFGTKGASVHVQEMVRTFRRQGHQVTVYCTKRGNRPGRPETESVPADLVDLPVITVPVQSQAQAADREAEIARVAATLAGLAAQEGAELAYERYSLFSQAGAQLATETGIPLVVEVNAPLIQEQQAHRTLYDAQAALAATIATFTVADVVSCVSEPVAHWVQRISPEAEVAVIPNGVDTERIRPRPRAQQSPRPFTVGFVGTLKPWHGTEVLLRAFAGTAARTQDRRAQDQRAQDRWHLEVIGTGPQLEDLQRLAGQLGITGQVHFHGAVPPSEVPALLGDLDVAVAPYPQPTPGSAHYFSPLKVYEYLAAGVAVVASAVGELPDILDDGRCGLLITPGDVVALTNALDQLARHPELRARLASAGRATAVAQHSWDHRCAELLRRLRPRIPVGSGGGLP